ncbi:MAG: PEP-CTERM system TPR-repeat protein PrsT, partial [Methyloceanibacter sp.]|nr:PEP-CTERM system TPR-repeat protein PrsT [Methyloceanibacter sp.]
VSAKAYLEKHDYSAATIQLKNALQKAPDDAEARYLLGVSLLESGNPGVAEIELRKALQLGLTSDEVSLMLAQSLQDQGAIAKLSTEFADKTLSSNAAQAELQATIGHALLNAQKIKEARAAFELALTKDSQNTSARLGIARLAALDNQLPKAMKMVEEVLASSPDSYRGQMLMGDLHAAQNRIAEAETAYRAALKAAPARIPPRTSLVALMVRAGEAEKAVTEVNALAKLAPGDPRTEYSRALVLIAQKKPAEAKKSLLQVLKVAPDDGPSLLLAGIVTFDTHAYLEAESYFRKVVEKFPDAIYPRRLLAASRLRTGQTERAMSDIQKLLAIAPNDPDILVLAGEAYLESGNVDQATRYFERVKSLKPDNSAVRTRLGQILAATGDTARAIKELEAAAATDAKSADADLALIATYLRQGEPDNALVAISALERKRPDSPISHNLRGLAYIQKKDASKARESFEKALAVEPTYFPAAQFLARMDLQDKKKENAQKRFKDLLAKDPNHEQALLSLAGILAGDRKYDEARTFIDKAIAAHPESATSRIALVRLQALKRDPKAALDAAQTAHNALPDNLLVLRMLGIAQQASGDLPRAIATFQRLAAAQPKAAEPQIRLAEAFLAAKRNDDAVLALQMALELDPEQSQVQRDLARVYALTGRIDAALAQSRKLQKSAAQSPVGYVIEADILIARKDLKSAESAVRRGIDKISSPALIV